MIPGITEATAGVKAGSAVIRAVNQTSPLPQWPNMHESLLALHAILEEWCGAAAGTSRLIRYERDRRLNRDNPRPSRSRLYANVTNVGRQFGGVVRSALSDIDALMTPKARLALRWNGQERRTAARRGLQTLLTVYFPDILTEFLDAVENRTEFVKSNGSLESVVHRLSDDELAAVARDAERTRQALVEVTNKLADLIVEKFPVDPKSAG